MTNELTATPSVGHLPEHKLLIALLDQLSLHVYNYHIRRYREIFDQGKIADQLKMASDEETITRESDKLTPLKQQNQEINFIIDQIIHTSKQLAKKRKELAEKAALENTERDNKTLKFYRDWDLYVDIGTYSGKAITTLLKYGKYLNRSVKPLSNLLSVVFTDMVNDIVSVCNYTISGIRDIWAGTSAKVDISQFARKTTMATASVRMARSIVAITLFALSISNPISFITLLLVGSLAGLYKDSYITYQNQKSVNQKKAELQKEIDILKEYQKQTTNSAHPKLNSYMIEQQKQIIVQHTEELDKLRGYSLRNRTRLGFQFFSIVGTALMVAGVFFPPVFFAGATLLTFATILKITEKLSSNKISSYFGQLTGFLPKPGPLQQASTVPQMQNTSTLRTAALLQIPPSSPLSSPPPPSPSLTASASSQPLQRRSSACYRLFSRYFTSKPCEPVLAPQQSISHPRQ